MLIFPMLLLVFPSICFVCVLFFPVWHCMLQPCRCGFQLVWILFGSTYNISLNLNSKQVNAAALLFVFHFIFYIFVVVRIYKSSKHNHCDCIQFSPVFLFERNFGFTFISSTTVSSWDEHYILHGQEIISGIGLHNEIFRSFY